MTRRRVMSRFLRVLLLVTAASQLVFLVAAQQGARRLGIEHAWLVGAALGVAGTAVMTVRARAGIYDERKPRLQVLLLDLPYFVHWCASLFALVPGVLACLLWPIVELVRGRTPALPGSFVLATYLLGFLISAYGVFVRRVWFVTEEVEVPIPGLDPRFDGYRIAHLSDLHIGTMTPKETGLRWTRAANRAAPDLTVITGDLVTSGTLFYDDIAAVVGDLRARDGVLVSMGNHDYFGDGEPLVKKLRATGARVLRNEGYLLERGEPADGAQPGGLWLSAIDDTWTRRDDMERALEKCPPTASSILLAHDPARFPAAAAKGVALTLSGHTHGGQVAIPFLARKLSLSHLAHKFHLGMYKIGRSTLYVHPGLGTTGPPMRLGVAPAVVVLTLRVAAA